MRGPRKQAHQTSPANDRDSELPTTITEKAGIWQRALVRTLVYRRVPLLTRRRLDRAILLRPEGCATLDAIWVRFSLAEKYGLSRDNLRTYARKLEQITEPFFAGNLAAAIMGCMPATYRTQVAAGSRIIMISRLVQALTRNEFNLEIPDLARLSSALRSAASTGTARTGNTRACGRNNDGRKRMNKTSSLPASLPTLTQAVKTVCGLEYPADQPNEPETPAMAKLEMAK